MQRMKNTTKGRKAVSRPDGMEAVDATTAQYRRITGLKEDDMAQLKEDDARSLLEGCMALIIDLEAAGDYSKAQRIWERIEAIGKYVNLVGGTEELRRQDWEHNHMKIAMCIHNHVLNTYGFPTVNHIAQETKLSRQTVHAHMKEGIAGKFYQERLKTWEFMTDAIMKNLYRASIDGNVAASKILLDNIYRLGRPAMQNIREQNNYVQINSTIIDELVVSELPEEARVQIVDIIDRHTKQTQTWQR